MINSVLQPSVTLQLEYYFANKTPSFVSTSIIHPSLRKYTNNNWQSTKCIVHFEKRNNILLIQGLTFILFFCVLQTFQKINLSVLYKFKGMFIVERAL